MKISVELTLTPFQNEYEKPIISLIKKLRESGLTILENPLSTQVYGAYDEVMKILTSEIKNSFEQIDNGIILLKIVKSDRSEYKPSF